MRSLDVFRPILGPVLVPSWLLAVGTGAMMPLLALAALGIGASASFAAILVGLMGAASLCLTVPAGVLIDRLGDTRAMILAGGAAFVLLGGIVSALAWHGSASLIVYTICVVLMAPVIDVWMLARQALVADTMPPEHMGKAMTALGGSQRIGNLVGPLIGAGLMLVFPLWSVFVLTAVMAVVAAAVVLTPAGRALEDSRASEGRRSDRSRRQEGLALRDLDVRWGAVLLAGVSIITLTVARSGQPVIVPLWGVEIGLHESAISLLVALGAALEIGIMFIGGYLKDRLGRSTTLVICLSIFGIGFLCMVVVPGFPGMLTAVIVMALGNGLGAGVNLTIGADLSPARGRARFLGVWAIFNNSGRLGGPAVVSMLIAFASLRAGIVFTGVAAIAGAVWMVCWANRIGLPGHRGRAG